MIQASRDLQQCGFLIFIFLSRRRACEHAQVWLPAFPRANRTHLCVPASLLAINILGSLFFDKITATAFLEKKNTPTFLPVTNEYDAALLFSCLPWQLMSLGLLLRGRTSLRETGDWIDGSRWTFRFGDGKQEEYIYSRTLHFEHGICFAFFGWSSLLRYLESIVMAGVSKK